MRKSLPLLLLLVPALACAGIQPGNWEMTITTQFAGAPNAMGPVKQTQCFTAKDARDPHKFLDSAATQGCQFQNQKDTGSELSFDLKCSGQIQMTGSGKTSYTSTSMQSDIELHGAAAGRNFTTRSHITGRRLGGC